MSKTDDMQRQRERRIAEAEQRAASAPKRAAPVEVAAVSPPAVAPAAIEAAPALPSRGARANKSDATEGRCPECGKTKPVANGVMASHQKGFGKACAGSRQPPA